MSIFTEEMPKPIIIEGLPPVSGSKRKTAGTKYKCVLCNRPTYRYTGNKPVCSYCSSKIESKNFEQKW